MADAAQRMGAAAGTGRLLARPGPPAPGAWPLPAGLHGLGMGDGRDGLLRVPANPALAAAPLPLLIMLHGAGSGAERALRRILPVADQALVMLPDSAGPTWDIIAEGAYGTDIARLDAALARIFAAWPIDPRRLIIAGFSDGASYALSLGLMNGDLFSHVLAFSPGFAAPACLVGKADVFLSHGTADEVLNIDHGSRRLVRQLGAGGWGHRYVEFDGGHTLPDPVARAAWDYVNETAEDTE
jgi:phospholipase/carboxylesterase